MNNNERMDPQKQFSKKLAWWTAVFWFAFITWLSIIIYLKAEVATYVIYMAIIDTVVMVLNVAAYTRNSIYEKAILAALEKVKLNLSLKGNSEEGEKEDEEDVKEDGDNG